jgi:hypothetical protein
MDLELQKVDIDLSLASCTDTTINTIAEMIENVELYDEST